MIRDIVLVERVDRISHLNTKDWKQSKGIISSKILKVIDRTYALMAPKNFSHMYSLSILGLFQHYINTMCNCKRAKYLEEISIVFFKDSQK